MPEHGSTISSPCEPNGSGELKSLYSFSARGCCPIHPAGDYSPRPLFFPDWLIRTIPMPEIAVSDILSSIISGLHSITFMLYMYSAY